MKSQLPGDTASLLDNAVAAHRQGNLKRAVVCYEQILGAEPDHAVATQLLGTIALQSGQYVRARSLLTRAIELDSSSGASYHNLARLDEIEGDLHSAVENYTRAFELMSDNADTSFSLANVLTSLGQMKESEGWYRQTLSINPAFAPAHRQLARLLNHSTVDSDVLAMEELFNMDGTNDSSRLQLAYGLGKAYEDLREFDQAFEYYRVANSLKRAELRFDINQWDVEIEKVKSAFSPELYTQFKGVGKKEARPIFVLGMPRSGTSLVEQILASHSNVFGGGELQTLNLAITGAMDVSRFPTNVAELSVQAFTTMADDYLLKTRQLSGGSPYVTDKNPDNFKLIGMIRLMFPDAIVIHTCRNPMDNCLSLYKNHFSDKGPFYSYDQAELGQYYRGYSRLMEHWSTVLPGFVYDVQYESLVSNQEAQTRALLDHCGLAFETACLEFHRSSRSVNTASAVQVRKSIYSSSVELWRQYESHLAPLVKALQ